MARVNHGIEPGQVYRLNNNPQRHWSVETIVLGPADIPHAVLRDVAEPSERRTISCSVLADRSQYRIIH